MNEKRINGITSFGLGAIILICLSCSSRQTELETEEETAIEHVKVFYQKDKFAGWPANWGMWNWGNEILVSYTMADHMDRNGHNYDVETAVNQFSRSLDGGETWQVEDAVERGITEPTWEHHISSGGVEPTTLNEPINFTADDFAFTFRMRNLLDGGTSFYYTYDRGKHWIGPFDLKVDLPGPEPAGIVSRTDYIIDGESQMTAFLTVGFREGDENWRQVACVRTTDGGLTWKHLAWIGPAGINSIMPSSVRLDENRILTMIRRTKPPEMVSFLSEDNGLTWQQQKNPVIVDNNGHPPTMLKLADGRLSLFYGIRHKETMPDGIGMYVTYSSDEGKTWSQPVQIRGGDGAMADMGYPRSIQRPDGKIVATYYYNNQDNGDKYRYIAASIFDTIEKEE